MSVLYRSQAGEDRWLDENWARLGLPERGFFVEFGAGTGEYLSNSYWLQYAKGWAGLLIEPDVRNVIHRDGCIIERCCVGPRGTVKLHLAPDEIYLSGTLRDYPDAVDVPSVPLSDLLEKHGIGRVDLISIDTEGTELEAWDTLDLLRWRPQIAIIELMTWGLPDQSWQVLERMERDGYRLVHRNQLNGIFQCRR